MCRNTCDSQEVWRPYLLNTYLNILRIYRSAQIKKEEVGKVEIEYWNLKKYVCWGNLGMVLAYWCVLGAPDRKLPSLSGWETGISIASVTAKTGCLGNLKCTIEHIYLRLWGRYKNSDLLHLKQKLYCFATTGLGITSHSLCADLYDISNFICPGFQVFTYKMEWDLFLLRCKHLGWEKVYCSYSGNCNGRFFGPTFAPIQSACDPSPEW